MKADSIRRALARLYARAFLREAARHKNTFSEAESQKCSELEKFIRTHDHLFFFIPLQSIPLEVKRDIFVRLADRFELGALLSPLISLMARHKRLFLFAEVCEAIVREYKDQHNRVSFHIKSSNPLSSEQQQLLIKYLQRETGKIIDYEVTLDAELIAGVRAQSDIFLFEHSVAQQLKVYNGNQAY